MILDVAYAANGMFGLCMGCMLLFSNMERGEEIPVNYKLLKNGLGIFCVVAAFFDSMFFLFENGHHLIMNNFGLPLLLDFILFTIISSVWRMFHLPEKKTNMLIGVGHALCFSICLMYLIGAFVYHGSVNIWNYESFFKYDTCLYSQILSAIVKLGLVILIFGFGSYNVYQGFKFHKRTKQLGKNNPHGLPKEKLLLLTLAYFLMVIGDSIWTSVSYDIFMLFLGPVIVFFMAVEVVNGLNKYLYYENLLKIEEAKEIAYSKESAFNDSLKKWIEDKRYSDPDIMVEDVAKELGVSYAYMNSYFKNIVRVPFRSWRISLRMEEAKRLILEDKTGMSITEIASKVGYNDRSNFFRHFKDYEGCTPNEFKEKNMPG